MSQTVASALDNRIVTFVDINDEYNCVICMQVADEPVRCSGLCSGIFCNGCMEQALTRSDSCPSCKKNDIAAPKDVILKNHIMNNQVYCLNKGNDQSDDINYQHTSTDSRKRKAAPDDDKCSWIGKYDQLAAHLNQCDYEMVKCTNNGCAAKVERCKLMEHLLVCVHRMANCENCNVVVKSAAMLNHLRQCPKVVVSCECSFECTRDTLSVHRDKYCPLVEICCDVIGCNAEMMRADYEKHQERAATHHVRLLSAALGKSIHEVGMLKQENVRLSAEVVSLQHQSRDFVHGNQENSRLSALVQQENFRLSTILQQLVKATNPLQIKWKVTNIAAKSREAAVDEKTYYSSTFDVFFHGSHKLYISVAIEGNKLGLFLCKNVALSDDKSRLDIGGTSFTIRKVGLPEKKFSFPPKTEIFQPLWNKGWQPFLANFLPFIDNDTINITIDQQHQRASSIVTHFLYYIQIHILSNYIFSNYDKIL